MAGQILKFAPWLLTITLLWGQGDQSRQSRRDQRLRLVSADLLENRQENGQEVQILTGSVVFRKGDMTLRTSQARFFRSLGKSYLENGVVMTRPGEHLTSDELVFHDAENLIVARGNVELVQENQTIRSPVLRYWTALDSAVAAEQVEMIQEDRTLTATEFRTVKAQGPRGASFWASGGVMIRERDRVVSADRMAYDDSKAALLLQGDSSIRDRTRNLQGQLIRVTYADDKMELAVVEQEAEATAGIDALIVPGSDNWRRFTDLLTGRRIEAHFTDDRLSSLNLYGMAISIYHVVEDSILQGINHASGDTMSLGFDIEGRLNRLQVRGGGRGRFEPEQANADVDTVVSYQGAFIDYDIPAEVTYLERDARVDYRDNGLSAGTIEVTWRDNLLRAEPAFGSQPTLYQSGRDPMEGEYMEFDLVTEKGRVVKGRTKLDNGYYHGSLIHRYPGNVFYVRQSLYTTCDLDLPHFYFAADRMKMLQGDKVIARPVILYIMDVPVLGLPFAVFPNQAGRRRSGWIMPSYGDNRNNGQYLNGLGYFWALSDYRDARILIDFYSRRGIRGTGRFRYSRRDNYRGQIGIRLFREPPENDIARIFSAGSQLQWSASWNHSQSIDPTQRLSVQATYTSDPGLNRRFGRTRQERLNQQIMSRASYAKSWRQSGSRLTLAVQDRYDLQAANRLLVPPTAPGQRIVERTQLFPGISYSRSRRTRSGRGGSGRPGNFSWSFSSRANNNQTVFWEADTVGQDTVWSPDRQIQRRSFARHTLNLGNSMKLARYINLSVNLRLREDWVPSHRLARKENGVFVYDGDIVYDEVEKFSARRTGTLGLSLQTNIYGLFPIRIGTLEAIRHTIKPSISYSYAPDFSQPIFGYFQRDSDGQLFDRFTGSPAGATPSSEQQSLSFGLTNLFQGKRVVEGKDIKFDILTWSMRGGYNFAADRFKIAPIRSSFRSPFLQRLNLDINMTHDFYAWDQDNQTKIDQVLPFPRLAQVSASTSLLLSGKHLQPRSAAVTAEVDTATSAELLFDELEEKGLDGVPERRGDQAAAKVRAGNLWEATLRLRYNLQPSLQKDIAETFWLDMGLKLALGPDWKFGYRARFNMLDQELVSHDLRLYRQLHCWEFIFNWTPGGLGRGFFLSINVLDSDLKDIKYESRGGIQSIFGR